MIKSCFRLLSALILLIISSACIKVIKPSGVNGTWLSVREDWTIRYNGEEVKETFDYGGSPGAQSACLKLESVGFDIFERGSSSAMKLVYYDRFSPVDPETSERIPTKLTVTMGRTTMTGENGEKWQVVLLMEDRMVLYYESGVEVQEGMEV